MLTITIPAQEFFDEKAEEFQYNDEVVLELQHSLVSLSKWESKHQKPFLGPETKTEEETLGYIEAMILTPDFPPDIVSRMSSENLLAVNDYIGSPQSGTTFSEDILKERRGRSEIITAELIYYWMLSYNIPFECENWHLNRLFALIRICGIKNSDSKEKKMSPTQLAARNRALNEARKAKLGTSG